MLTTRTKLAMGLLVALYALGTGLGLLARPVAETPPNPPQVKKPAPPAPKPDGKAIEVGGRVLDPDGRPLKGARLVFVYASVEKIPEKVWAISAPDGRFHFSVARSIEGAAWSGDAWRYTYVVAAAEGHGFAWARVRPATSGNLTLRLVKDDVPIQGRVLDLQGRPVAGVTVRIDRELFVPTKGDLTDWLKALKASKRDPGRLDANDFTTLNSAALGTLFPPVKTRADGRFLIKGIGRERVARLHVEGPRIATQQVEVMTRPVAMTRWAPRAAPFDLLAVPARPVVGVVHDKDTGKPLAGVTVRSHRIAGAFDLNGLVSTISDKEGCYRLVGLPKGQGNAIVAETHTYWPRANDRPYLAAIRKVGDPPGLEPVTVDVALKRGIWIKGRVTDKTTRQPVRGGFEYFCFEDNPLAAELPLARGIPGGWTQKDGSFRVVALPGRGLIAVRADRDKYRMGVGADQIKGQRVDGGFFATYPYRLSARSFHTIVEVSPKPGDEVSACDVILDPGRTLKGTVLGPDGKPLAGARAAGLRPLGYWGAQPLEEAAFTLWGLSPGERRLLQMIHEGTKGAGWLEVRGDAKAPIRIRLKPWGSVVGRLVTPDGKPVTKGVIGLGALPRVQAGKDGTFRIDGLAPGLKYNLSVVKEPNSGLEISGKSIKDLTIQPGETKDLGDVVVKPIQ